MLAGGMKASHPNGAVMYARKIAKFKDFDGDDERS
jgi:hypothetical protein